MGVTYTTMEDFLKFLYSWVSAFISGLCLAFLWKWFVTPLGVPAITILHAMGLTMALSVVFATKDPKIEITFKKISFTIIYNIVALVFGYLIHLGM